MKRSISVRRSWTIALCAAGLLSTLPARHVLAQAPHVEPAKPQADTPNPAPVRSSQDWQRWQASSVDRAYKLKYAQSAQDANEVLTAMRNVVEPQTKIFLASGTETIVVHAPEEEQARVVKLLATLDQPRSSFRLTYTLTELEGTRKVGVQHFAMVVLSGQRTTVKQGSRVPLLVSSPLPTKPGEAVPAYTYIDIGMSFESTVVETQGGGVLRTRVEQSSVAPDSMAANGSNPVIRQTLIEGSVALAVRKPLNIGSLDVPGSTHHFDVEVVMEPVN